MPAEMTFQEVMDAIFYGKSIDVVSKPIAVVDSSIDVQMFIRGAGLVHYAELYQNNELIGTFQKDQFVQGQLTTKSLPIKEDTTFLFKVYYCNGSLLTDTWITKVSYGLFVGLLPQWYSGSNITYEYLTQLNQEDSFNN